MTKQAMNPFLPLDEYIPDGEPHVFGDRIYLYGSHDSEGGTRYCSEENYVCWSASIYDLTDWKYEGVIFEAKQNPGYVEGKENDLYAPDVVQGNDGRYYLYYNMVEHESGTGFHDKIHVAVCDSPAGRYEHYGYVKNPDGTVYRPYLDADPAVINDDGVIRLYHGWSFSMVAAWAHAAGNKDSKQQNASTQTAGHQSKEDTVKMLNKMLFARTEEDTKDLRYPLMGANTVTLADDMLTVVGEVMRIVPGQFDTPKDSSFYGHSFYEASSIRKVNGMYYFIYSSENSHELCYATSQFPDHDFVYRGTIISNGDVGYQGRRPEDRLNMTANNHGSLEYINGQWYIFYHRQTHNTTFSRQACAEPVTIQPDGTIEQVECTSCGLNGGPLAAEGTYAAACACNITNGHMPHATNTAVNADIPYITDGNEERYITNIKERTLIGFKYFEFNGPVKVFVTSRGKGNGRYILSADESGTEEKLGEIIIKPSEEWKCFETEIEISGNHALYLHYEGSDATELLEIAFL
ncbi:MAG: family 43 glycosylhydrolase [Oliverpabstia sp.]